MCDGWPWYSPVFTLVFRQSWDENSSLFAAGVWLTIFRFRRNEAVFAEVALFRRNLKIVSQTPTLFPINRYLMLNAQQREIQTGQLRAAAVCSTLGNG